MKTNEITSFCREASEVRAGRSVWRQLVATGRQCQCQRHWQIDVVTWLPSAAQSSYKSRLFEWIFAIYSYSACNLWHAACGCGIANVTGSFTWSGSAFSQVLGGVSADIRCTVCGWYWFYAFLPIWLLLTHHIYACEYNMQACTLLPESGVCFLWLIAFVWCLKLWKLTPLLECLLFVFRKCIDQAEIL